MGTQQILNARLDKIQQERADIEAEQGDLVSKMGVLDDKHLALTSEFDAIIADLATLGYTRT